MKFRWPASFILGCVSLAAVSPEARAQKDVLRPCPGVADCVEFTVRYHIKDQKGPAAYSGSKKVQLLRGDPAKPGTITAADPYCELEKGSCTVTKDKVNVLDVSGLRFLQGRQNPTCYLICNGGWCWEACY
jgi:hypothetical protein